MTAPAPAGTPPPAARRTKLRAAFVAAGLALGFHSARAAAQVGAAVSIYSDERFRGVSLSDGRPVAIFDLAYDAPNGIYGAASGSLVASREGIRALGISLNTGYARRLTSGLTADVGIVHSRFSRYSALEPGRNYTEAYVGIAGKNLGGRISVSPDYLGAARWTVHGELNGHVDLTERLVLDGAIGILVPVGPTYESDSRSQLDGRIGLAERLGRLTLHAAITGQNGGLEIYSGEKHSRAALVVGVSYAL